MINATKPIAKTSDIKLYGAAFIGLAFVVGVIAYVVNSL